MKDWLNKLQGEAVLDVVPKSFYSMAQITEATKYSQTHIRKILQQEIAAGRIRIIKVRSQCGQRSYPLPYYGPAK
jgi:hypothetical protein